MYSRLAANILSISTLLKTHLKQIEPDASCIRPFSLSLIQKIENENQNPINDRLMEHVNPDGVTANVR